MSAKASGYAKELVVCPNGELISAREKLVLMVLADSHQVKEGSFTYPSVESIAEDARCDRRNCQRYLAALERKGVVRRLRPPNQGAGMRTFYFFPEIEPLPEGWQDAALFFVERASKGRQKDGIKGVKRAAGTQLTLIERAREREPELELEQIPPSPQGANALGGDGGNRLADSGVNNALDCWMDNAGFTAKRLRRKLRVVHTVRMRAAGKAGDDVTAEMADAWARLQRQGRRLYRHPTAAEFFEGGLWLDSNLWPWNTEVLNQEDRAAGASVGSGR